MVAPQELLATTMGQLGSWMSTTSIGSLLWSSVRSSFWLVCRPPRKRQAQLGQRTGQCVCGGVCVGACVRVGV